MKLRVKNDTDILLKTRVKIRSAETLRQPPTANRDAAVSSVYTSALESPNRVGSDSDSL